MDRRLRVGACLSLSGRFAKFGRQAALGLAAWRSLDGSADLLVEDDHSDRPTLAAIMPGMAKRCDILLGPYSTILTRAAARIAADSGWLLWNHGGSGDDVERSGHVVSVLTPASRYAEPFLRYLASNPGQPRDLCIIQGPGSFGRQVTDGAAMIALRLGIRTARADPGHFPPGGLSREWDLFSAGVFEQDAEMISKALRLPNPPRRICAVAAGVREFAQAVDDPAGVFGIAQWFPGSGHEAKLGPTEDAFLKAYADESPAAKSPDYPAVQAAASAVLAVHCARLVGGTSRDLLWDAASRLDTSTLFGGFRIDPAGTQAKHQMVLMRWTDRNPNLLG